MSKEILGQYQSSTRAFLELARSIAPEKLNVAPASGEWSPAYVIHHLADSDAHFLVRFLNLLSVDNPEIVPFDEESFPTALIYIGRNVTTSIASIEASCNHLVDILSQVSEADWVRTGFHPQRGSMTMTALLELTTNHRNEHLQQLSK
jgi:uncharacterized damage-inducible protein DinB